jgi:hypothetical protein
MLDDARLRLSHDRIRRTHTQVEDAVVSVELTRRLIARSNEILLRTKPTACNREVRSGPPT